LGRARRRLHLRGHQRVFQSVEKISDVSERMHLSVVMVSQRGLRGQSENGMGKVVSEGRLVCFSFAL